MQENIVVRCPRCERERRLKYVGDYSIGHEDGEPSERFTFGHCADCALPFVVVQQDLGQGFDAEDSSPVYPVDELELKIPLPPGVSESYDSARGCLRAKQWRAAAVMVGASLEAMCRHELGEDVMLFQGVKRLAEQGKVSAEIAEWAHALRFLRNVGAHALEQPITKDDARDAVDFAQAILETLYQLRPKFEKMMARRKDA